VPTKKGEAPQYRWKGVVDIDEAHAAVSDVLSVWREVSRWPDSPPFEGGVWDSWPRRLAQGIAFLKGETAAVVAYLRSLEE
jgi:hypothetical protein